MKKILFAALLLSLFAQNVVGQLTIGIGPRYQAPQFPGYVERVDMGGLALSLSANFQWIDNGITPFVEPGIYGAYSSGMYDGWTYTGVGAGADLKIGLRISIWYLYAGASVGYEKFAESNPCGCYPDDSYIVSSGWNTRYNAGTGFQFGRQKNWRIAVQLELPTNTNFKYLVSPPVEAATIMVSYRFSRR